jgi:prepilin signal peptidase PulO-like enzyme (type II secretory pathway)
MITTYFIYFVVLLFGACIGSFLNCYIYRLEKGLTMKGRSFCPNCKATLHWQDLFPIFSYLFLRGKCRQCKNKISIQYLLVEVFTAIIFLTTFIINLQQKGVFAGIFAFYILSVLIIIFVYDLKHFIIPDKVLFPAIGITILYRVINFELGLFLNFVIAGVIISGFFFLIFLFTKGRGIGFGDVKLAILMGLLLGIKSVLAATFLAFLAGAVVGLILMVFKRKGLKTELPFAPFLIGGTFLAIWYGPKIANWYLNYFT